MEVVLSFGAAALLYLVTAELLREAHEERESTSATAMFFVGFLVFLVVGMTMDRARRGAFSNSACQAT